MASAKRKQDEKHLKILREMVSLQHNKHCFDCHQRGPTYVNMTIGSFICTSCSGLLRGLNPPHRVKSISMTSFTSEEIDFLRSRGSEFCRQVWLGLYDSRTHMDAESKDENKRKDFMAQKYERKRYYVAPTEAMHEDARRMNATKQPETKALKGVVGNSLPSLRVQQPSNTQPAVRAVPQPAPSIVSSSAVASVPGPSLPAPGSTTAPATVRPPVQLQAQPQPHKPAGMDLLGDLGGDPFAQSAQPAAGGGGFANFADFQNPATQGANTPQQPPGVLPLQGGQPAAAPVATVAAQTTTTASTAGAPGPQPGGNDRYAALADLDSVFGSTSGPTVHWDSPWGCAPPGAGTSTTPTQPPPQAPAAAQPPQPPSYASVTANPFGGGAVSTVATTAAVGNPFMAGAGGVPQHMGQPAIAQPAATASMAQPGIAQPGMVIPGGIPSAGMMAQYAQMPPMQNGAGFGTAWAGQVSTAAMQYPAQPAQPAPQYMKAGQGFVTSPGQQPATGWPTQGMPQQAANPFMGTGMQQTVPPRSGSTNPFL